MPNDVARHLPAPARKMCYELIRFLCSRRMLLFNPGVNLFNISLDTLCPDKFQYITRRPGFDKVMRALDDLCETWILAQAHGGIPSNGSAPRTFRMPKLNVVVTRGVNEGEIGDFVELTRDRPVDVRFIEFMPFDANSWSESKFVSFEEMLAAISRDTRFADIELAKLDDETSSTSKGYRMEGFAGQLGFITSMSRPFCSGCNRLRVTADGNLKVCLFGDESQSVSLRDVLRSAEQFGEQPQQLLSDVISLAISGKAARLGGHKDMRNIAERSRHNRPMIQIGG